MFVCYYCRKKRDSMGYIETKKHPCCAKCNREKKIKDDPNNPYTIASNKMRNLIEKTKGISFTERVSITKKVQELLKEKGTYVDYANDYLIANNKVIYFPRVLELHKQLTKGD